MADLSNFSKLWAIGAVVPGCMVPGPVATSVIHSSLEYEHLIGDVVGVWA